MPFRLYRSDDDKITFAQALWLPVTVKRALRVSLIVGTILIAINQGDHLLSANWPPVWKIILTFIVPYSVSSYSTAAFLSGLCKRNPNISVKELLS